MVFSPGLTEAQTSPEVSPDKVWNKTETPPDFCSKLLGLMGKQEVDEGENHIELYDKCVFD